MQYRTLGRGGIRISEIGCGCWPIGGGWGAKDDAADVRSLRFALESGITFFDTAMGYGGGRSEELIGEAFEGVRDKVVIASKIPPKGGWEPVFKGVPSTETFPRDYIVESVHTILRRLKSDYVDLVQFHAWNDSYTRQDEWRRALLDLKKQGKIRAIGVSANDWDPYGAMELAKSGHVDSIQVIYNIFEQRPADALFPAAMASGTGIIVRVPFEEGLLSGQIKPGYKFADGDWRAKMFTPQRLEQAMPRIEALGQFLAPDRPTLAALSLKFCLGHPAVSTVIPGMRKTEHIMANTAASDGRPLDDQTLAKLAEHRFEHGWGYPWSNRTLMTWLAK